jgi:hypothetical protein
LCIIIPLELFSFKNMLSLRVACEEIGFLLVEQEDTLEEQISPSPPSSLRSRVRTPFHALDPFVPDLSGDLHEQS